jgi:SulP family sulfate permease
MVNLTRSQLKLSKAIAQSDLVAGLTTALVNIPEGMAFALVAGVNPVYGLYSGVVAPIVGALTASSYMVVYTLTNETAITTAAAFENLDGWTVETIFAFTIMVGIFCLLFGLLRWGSLLRFISESVMTGFITGAAVLVILGQLHGLTGIETGVSGSPLQETIEWLTSIEDLHLQSTLLGLVTIVAIVLLNKTRVHKFSLIIALVLATLFVWLTGMEVLLVGDFADIGRGLPTPAVPDFSQLWGLILPAFSLAVLSVALSAGVAQNYPNSDGSHTKANQDFAGIGAANILGGLFQGLPVTGALSRTTVSVGTGAQTRWAPIFAGLILALILLTVVPLAELIPEPALAGLLIFVGFEAINQRRVSRAWSAHTRGRIALVATFLLMLLIPIQFAVLVGVFISLLVYVYSASLDIRVVHLVPLGDGRFIEQQEVPQALPSNEVTVLAFYGPTFFAAVDTLVKELPGTDETVNAVLVLEVRGLKSLTDTFFTWLERYAREMHAAGNRVILAEVDPRVHQQLQETKLVNFLGADSIFEAQEIIGASIDQAVAEGNEWVNRERTDNPSTELAS